jgi:hypothetical protein
MSTVIFTSCMSSDDGAFDLIDYKTSRKLTKLRYLAAATGLFVSKSQLQNLSFVGSYVRVSWTAWI